MLLHHFSLHLADVFVQLGQQLDQTPSKYRVLLVCLTEDLDEANGLRDALPMLLCALVGLWRSLTLGQVVRVGICLYSGKIIWLHLMAVRSRLCWMLKESGVVFGLRDVDGGEVLGRRCRTFRPIRALLMAAEVHTGCWPHQQILLLSILFRDRLRLSSI